MYFKQDMRNLNFHSQINPENAKSTWTEYKDLSPLRISTSKISERKNLTKKIFQQIK